MRTLAFLVALAIFGMPRPALAQDDWQLRLSPYAWLAGQKGEVATIPGLPPVTINLSPREALENTEGGAMIMLDARRGPHGFVADLVYTHVQIDVTLLPEPIGLGMKSISRNTLATAAYQHEWFRQGQTVVDLIAGVRYWKVDSELRFSGGLGALAGRSVRSTKSWIDPGIGIKARTPLGGSRFYLEAGAGIGGFGAGSKRFYDLAGNVGYQWTRSIGTTLGYRLFDVDYERGDFLYDVRQEGWQLGLTWAF